MSDAPLVIETEIEIAAAPEKVWSVLIDFALYGEWNPYLIHVEGDLCAGTLLQVTQVPAAGLRPMTAPVELVLLRPFEMVWIGGLPDLSRFRGRHSFIVEAASAGARFRHFEHFEGYEAAAILLRYRVVIESNFNRFNTALKTHCERDDR
jgi:hypothetical protein